MATGAGRHRQVDGHSTAQGNAQAPPPTAEGDTPLIEVSDADYRSFCFPCHALDEAGDCNDGY